MNEQLWLILRIDGSVERCENKDDARNRALSIAQHKDERVKVYRGEYHATAVPSPAGWEQPE